MLREEISAVLIESPLMTTDLLALFKEKGALLEGHFLLSSGLHSPRYLQCARILMYPDIASRLGAELAASLKDVPAARQPDVVVSPALGGVIVGHEVARGFACPGLFTEREQGVMKLRRGFALNPGSSAVVVEDVITTGKSTREVMEVVEGAGARVVGVLSLVDRSGGSVDLGVPRRSLLTLEVPTYEASACPLCRTGSPAEKPGSRTAS